LIRHVLQIVVLHLNDQNGLKLIRTPFGSANLRAQPGPGAERNGYGSRGEFVCFDVHPFRRPNGALAGTP
jgi:hypothetical protein